MFLILAVVTFAAPYDIPLDASRAYARGCVHIHVEEVHHVGPDFDLVERPAPIAVEEPPRVVPVPVPVRAHRDAPATGAAPETARALDAERIARGE